MKMFQVGGCIRDELLGLKSKDVDFTVVLEDQEFNSPACEEWGPFEYMASDLRARGFEIFLETPEYLTIRARFPRDNPEYDKYKGLTADFVLARKEGEYTDGRRPDVVVPGTLLDDQRRRDFTMNSIAKDEDGTLIDPFGGVEDIESKFIRAVGDPHVRLREDALRAVRALRFSVTKGFFIDGELGFAMETKTVLDSIEHKISDERIQQELSKMFRFDTIKSLIKLHQFPALTSAIFAGDVSLDATMKLKGRGK